MKRFSKLLIILVLLFTLIACTKEKVDLKELIDTIELNIDKDNVVSNITLTEKLDNENIYVIWNSSNTNVLSNTGVLNMPEEDTDILLTLTLKYKDDLLSKYFPLIIRGSNNFAVWIDGEKFFLGFDKEVTLPEAIIKEGYDFSHYKTNNNKTYMQGDKVVGPLVLESVYDKQVRLEDIISGEFIIYADDENIDYVASNIVLVKEVENERVTVSWESNNENILDTNGMLTMPEEDTLVTLTLTLTKDNQTLSKDFVITIKGKKSFTITIINGKEIETIFNGKNTSYKLPVPTLKEGYHVNYYVDNDNNKYNVGETVSGPLTLSPVYLINVYEVNFYVYNRIYKQTLVEHGNTIGELPQDPSIDHETFVNWYIGDVIFNPNIIIVEDVNVTALFDYNIYTVNFYINEELVETKEVKDHDRVLMYWENEEGYLLDGWYLSDNTEYNFFNEVTKDLDLYATKTMVTAYLAILDDKMWFDEQITFISYVSGYYNNYTYISDLNNYSFVLERPSGDKNLSLGDKVLVKAKKSVSGGLYELSNIHITKLSGGYKTPPNIVYDNSIKVFNNTHIGRKFDFNELNVYEVTKNTIYADFINRDAYPVRYVVEIKIPELNDLDKLYINLKHRRIEVINMHLIDIYYYNGYTLIFNLHDENNMNQLALNDSEKIDDTFNYIETILKDSISEGNLLFPTEYKDTFITWESDNESLITSDGIVKYNNMTNLEESVKVYYTIRSNEEVSYRFPHIITIIDNTRIITNTLTFGNIGLNTYYDDLYYTDSNNISFNISYSKKSGDSLIVSTNRYSDLSIEFPKGLISFSFEYRVKSSRPLKFYINVNEYNFGTNSLYYDEVELKDYTSNKVYTYNYDGVSHPNKDVTFLLFLNDHSNNFELEILSFTYKAIKVD